MASSARTAKVTLSYPLYAVDFDPDDDRRLIVGGGGGEGRSGVGNKIVSAPSVAADKQKLTVIAARARLSSASMPTTASPRSARLSSRAMKIRSRPWLTCAGQTLPRASFWPVSIRLRQHRKQGRTNISGPS